ncbi:TIGR01621 family pseudouridine synthase [Bacteriovorax sp. Seq25_V]|uniref:TIGR01621 family pseudouridine synthase n=1 Tax=Bacteriovorax sp. Seq25_V TaxID=1201288 RepID=UPI0005560BCC|nr:TIGR01621 family pseudouridine synthase [Bacteriovorax sp. Seq25_V]
MLEQIKIIFENHDFLVISKPAELSYHGDGLHEFLRKQTNGDIFGVHRLDKVTSGILIFAKNSEMAAVLSKKFESKEMKKIYIAMSDKRPSKKQGLIRGDMEKSRDGSYKLTRTLYNPAITKFETRQAQQDGLRMFILYPQTGRTHQLRVAMKSLGSPILGDKRYGGSDSDRTYLHAFELSFELNGEEFSFKVLPTGKHWPSDL